MHDEILRQLEKHGFQAFIVGGAVRDILLGVQPNDFDIATDATREDIVRVFPHGVPVAGKKDGAYGIVIVNGIEVAPFRRDVTCDGRQADVEYTSSLEVDLARRDFTINAMAMSRSGHIVDPFGGHNDLVQRHLRFVGDARERINEDHLRSIRFARFAARYSFTTEPASVVAVRTTTRIDKVSGHRIYGEMRKANEFFGDFIFSLYDVGLLFSIFPELEQLVGSTQDYGWHPEGDVFTHTMLAVFNQERSDPFLTKIAVLFHDIGKPETRGTIVKNGKVRVINHGHADVGAKKVRPILRRLGASNAEIDEVAWYIKMHMNAHDKQASKRTFRRWKMQTDVHLVDNLFKVALADSNGVLKLDKHMRDERNINLWKEVRNEAAIQIPITGHDLLPHMSGRTIGVALAAVKEAACDNPNLTKQEAMKIALSI